MTVDDESIDVSDFAALKDDAMASAVRLFGKDAAADLIGFFTRSLGANHLLADAYVRGLTRAVDVLVGMGALLDARAIVLAGVVAELEEMQRRGSLRAEGGS